MARTYKPATFQPTVRPDWAGVLPYLSVEERVSILEAILRFPAIDVPNSPFWTNTIKPDLELQYRSFVKACTLKKIAVRNRWEKSDSVDVGIDIYNTCTTDVVDMEKILKDKEKEKGEGKGKGKVKELKSLEENSLNLSTTRRNGAVAPRDGLIPSREEVLAFAAQQNDMAGVGGFACSAEQADAFWSHYEAVGWRKGNEANTPIRNWQAALRYWCLRNNPYNGPALATKSESPASTDEDLQPLTYRDAVEGRPKYDKYVPALEEWLKYKPIKNLQQLLAFTENLAKMSDENGERALAIVQQSIGNGWNSIRPLPKDVPYDFDMPRHITHYLTPEEWARQGKKENAEYRAAVVHHNPETRELFTQLWPEEAKNWD